MRSHQEFPGVLIARFPAGDVDRGPAATDGDLTRCHQASQGLAFASEGAFSAGRLGLDVDGLNSARGNLGAPGYEARTAHDCQDQKPWYPGQHCWSPRPSLRSQRCCPPRRSRNGRFGYIRMQRPWRLTAQGFAIGPDGSLSASSCRTCATTSAVRRLDLLTPAASSKSR